jgi:RNA polymerase sigma factor (sigma-70 family)
MANAPASKIVRLIRHMADGEKATDLSDRELLERFRIERDEDSFQGLVWRHGAMVLRVCRNVLGHEQDAEDAFQSTFLVLARRCGSIRKLESLGGWLHGVAHRTALHTKRTAGRRRLRERQAKPTQSPGPVGELSWREVQAILDEEIRRLPEWLRAPFVLCILEGRRGTDVARELRLKEGTVWSRLAAARSRLQKRLTRRGLSLPMVLASAVVSGGSASALVPASLVTGTVKNACVTAASVSARIEAIGRGVGNAMFGSRITTKVKAAIACLAVAGAVTLCTSLLTLGEAGAQQSGSEAKEQPKPAPTKDEKVKQAGVPAIEEAKDAVTFNAQVLDPDGKPVEGAEVMFGWWEPFAREWMPWIVTPFQPKTGATSGADGRLRITMTKAEIFAAVDTPRDQPWRFFQLVVSAKGHAPGFVTLEPGQKDVKIQLTRDVPATGLVLDLQGRPVPGASVRVDHMKEGKEGQHILFVNSWPGLPAKFTTDKDGRFTLTGIGPKRRVLLHISGPTIEHKLVEVTTPAENEKPKGDSVKLFVGPTKPVRGIVRDKATDKPLAGIEVYGDREAHRGGVRAVTDEKGRYELVGLPKAGSWELEAYPSGGQPYLAGHQVITDSEGLKPIDVDFALRKGIPVRLQVIDKITREPVRGVVRYSPLLGNPLHSEARRPASNWASDILHMPDKDHCYNFVAFPGPGIIYAWVGGPYLPASLLLDPADEKNGYTMHEGKDPDALGWLAIFEGYRIIDPKPTDKPLSVVIELDPGHTIRGSLKGPDGKPVSGAIAYGLNHNPKYERAYSAPRGDQNLKSETFTATGLHPKAPRTVSFVHKDRKLVGLAIVRGDEKEPITVNLQPWGVVAGRLIDAEGKPLAGVGVLAHYPGQPSPGIWIADRAEKTDAEGRFRLDRLMPAVSFSPILTGKTDVKLSAEALKELTIKPGESKELGDIRVQVVPAKKQARGNDK